MSEISGDTLIRIQKLQELIDHYMSNKQLETALILSKIILKEVEDTTESDSHDVGMILSFVGRFNALNEKYNEAEKMYKRAIPILEKYNKDLDFIALIHGERGKSYIKMKRYKEAEISSKKALEILEKIDDVDVSQLAMQKVIMSDVFRLLEKPNEAKQFMRDAVSIYAKKFGICSFQINRIYGLLETVYFSGTNEEECIKFNRNCNEIEDIIPICLIAMHCVSSNFPQAAFEHYLHAVNILESTGFLDESQMSEIYIALGECYLEVGRDFGTIINDTINRALRYVKSVRLKEAKEIKIKNSNSNRANDNDRSRGDKVPIFSGINDIIDDKLKNLSVLKLFCCLLFGLVAQLIFKTIELYIQL